ncbi:MAG: cell division protein ZapA [Ignavibacteriae bacterium]|jgi:cell division protein ZapA (FtsZ GTPase activity inhibitor)|nr:cell division protein ZapA [Ignavibacteriota bacterium]
MSTQVKVTIGGKEFTLRGDDEQKLVRAAKEVDDQIRALQSGMMDQSTQMQAIVAALNLAEQKISAEETLEKESLLLSSELENMATFLREQLKK